MGVASHQPAVFPPWPNRSEVPVGTVKAGGTVRRDPCEAEAESDPRRTRQVQTPWKKQRRQSSGYRQKPSAFDPTVSAARCQSAVKRPGHAGFGSRTGGIPSAPDSAGTAMLPARGENANPKGMVQAGNGSVTQEFCRRRNRRLQWRKNPHGS